MDIEQIMKQYNYFDRLGMQAYAPGERLSSQSIVKHVVEDKHGSLICFYDLEGEGPEAIIQGEIDFFMARAKSFEWKVYGTDIPDIGALLLSMGFSEGDREAFMVLDLHDKPLDLLANGNSCLKVSNAAGIRDAISVQREVWSMDFSDFENSLLNQLETDPESESVYVGYDDGIPVASSRISFNGSSPFAGLWSGSTLASHRGKGYYTDMLIARADEARQRGVRYLTIDASDMSRPIVEKYGFQYVTHTIPYVYRCD